MVPGPGALSHASKHMKKLLNQVTKTSSIPTCLSSGQEDERNKANLCGFVPVNVEMLDMLQPPFVIKSFWEWLQLSQLLYGQARESGIHPNSGGHPATWGNLTC